MTLKFDDLVDKIGGLSAEIWKRIPDFRQHVQLQSRTSTTHYK